MQLSRLPAMGSGPADEESNECQQAYSNYLKTDEQYLNDIGAIDFDGDQAVDENENNAERALKDRLSYSQVI